MHFSFAIRQDGAGMALGQNCGVESFWCISWKGQLVGWCMRYILNDLPNIQFDIPKLFPQVIAGNFQISTSN